MSMFWRYFTTRFPIGQYVVYVTLWVFALDSVLAVQRSAGGAVAPSWPKQVGGAVVVYTVLFFMRTVDEIKDLDYDRQFSPDRPLVTGEVTLPAMRVYLVGSAVIAVVVSAVVGWQLVPIASAVMLYALLLVQLEKWSTAFADSMFRNILVAVQLKTGLALFVAILAAIGNTHVSLWRVLLTVVAFVCAYTHWEIARKTERPQFSRPGEKLYSSVVGTYPSLAISYALLVIACLLASVLTPGAIRLAYLVPLAITAAGMGVFAVRRDAKFPVGAPALVGYLAFLVVSVLQAATADGIGWFAHAG